MSIFKRIINAIEDISDIVGSKNSICFYQIEKVAADFLRENSAKGFSKPVFLEILLTKNKEEQELKLTAYYKNAASDKYMAQDAVRKFAEITDIPAELKRNLEKNGELKIKLSDPLELLVSAQVPVQKTIDFQGFEKWVESWQKDFIKNDYKLLSSKVTIEDKLFKKTVQGVFKVSSNKKEEIKVKSVAFMDILNLPQDAAAVLAEKGCLELEIE